MSVQDYRYGANSIPDFWQVFWFVVDFFVSSLITWVWNQRKHLSNRMKFTIWATSFVMGVVMPVMLLYTYFLIPWLGFIEATLLILPYLAAMELLAHFHKFAKIERWLQKRFSDKKN